MATRRSAAQIAASKRNLEKARAARVGRPYFGKGSYSEHMAKAEKKAPKGVAYFGPGSYDEYMAKAKKAFEGGGLKSKKSTRRRRRTTTKK